MWQCNTLRRHVGPFLIGIAMLGSAPATALVAEGECAPEIVGHAWSNSPPLSVEGPDATTSVPPEASQRDKVPQR